LKPARRLVALCRGAWSRIGGVVNIADIAVVPHGQREIPAEGVVKLYRAEGWWPERTAEQVRAVLRVAPAVGAWRGQDLIGFARAVTDGILRAYVEDVIVSPDWRGMGVGQALLGGLMEQLRPAPVVTLFCSPDLVRYYEASSFRRTRQVVMHRAWRVASSGLGAGG
jgi:ribosomal protein S18 acetylase RimI-like enzyme